MQDIVQQFVERMGLMMEADGLPRSAGRIFGFLLLAEHPFSLDELADELQVSKASVSTNARLLEQLGILERISSPGDRRDFYRMRQDAWERVMEVGRRRWEAMRVVLSENAESLPDEMQDAKHRLREAAEFHGFLLGEAGTMIERWRAHKRAALAASDAAAD
ncbi:MAG: MarR family transcriptional regulator [Gemmatimonadetes bacterium]|nr:MarR family transcriptional regulator [Gemmatimonadota bacterium]